jgi:hypothetical protein
VADFEAFLFSWCELLFSMSCLEGKLKFHHQDAENQWEGDSAPCIPQALSTSRFQAPYSLTNVTYGEEQIQFSE